MLATVGFVVPEFVRVPGEAFSFESIPNVIDAHDALLDTSMKQILLWISLWEAMSLGALSNMNEFDRSPGDWGFDPLNLYPTDPAKQEEMRNKELKNGRLVSNASVMCILVHFFCLLISHLPVCLLCLSSISGNDCSWRYGCWSKRIWTWIPILLNSLYDVRKNIQTLIYLLQIFVTPHLTQTYPHATPQSPKRYLHSISRLT